MTNDVFFKRKFFIFVDILELIANYWIPKLQLGLIINMEENILDLLIFKMIKINENDDDDD